MSGRARACIVVVALAASLAGCGTTNHRTTSEASTSAPQPPAPADLLAAAQRRLEAKGFVLRDSNDRRSLIGFDAADARAVIEMTKGKLTLTIARFPHAVSATRAARSYDPIRYAKPEQLAVVIRGPTVYVGVVDAPARVPRRVFADAVATAEAE